jgi:hypothetical protein
MQQASEVSSILLHNQNAHRYLLALEFPDDDVVSEMFDKKHQAIILNLKKLKQDFNKKEKYGDKFSKLIQIIEENTQRILEVRDGLKQRGELKKLKSCDDFIRSIFDNKNQNLAATYDAIQSTTREQTPASEPLENTVGRLLDDPWYKRLTKTKTTYPSKEEWPDKKYNTIRSDTFIPQRRTNIPHIFNYNFPVKSDGGVVVQLRIGTQAQRIDNVDNVSNAFKLFIAVENDAGKKHIYFNNLGLDRKRDPVAVTGPRSLKKSVFQLEGARESAFTIALHAFEKDHDNLYVITLPSDKGWMNPNFHEDISEENSIKGTTVFDDFLKIAMNRSDIENPNGDNIRDFYFSDKVKDLLFAKENEKTLFERLLNNSFNYLGLDKNSKLTKAQQQAVYYHFIKFELTDEIITIIGPDSLNFSCKDAIDRGELSSSYYNLVKSFQANEPINYDQFDMALHGPAAMVKGRGMNTHIHRIWNAVDVYVNNHYDELLDNKDKAWLIEWRDRNCPPARVNDVLAQRIKDAEKLIASTDNKIATKALEKVIQLDKEDGYDKKVLLTILALNLVLVKNPTDKVALDRCAKAINMLPMTDDIGKMLRGLLSIFIGNCLKKINPEISEKFIKAGEGLIQGKIAADLSNALKESPIDDNDKAQGVNHKPFEVG